MDFKIIESALNSALSLLNSEIESVCIDELREEYLQAITNIENALVELKK